MVRKVGQVAREVIVLSLFKNKPYYGDSLTNSLVSHVARKMPLF